MVYSVEVQPAYFESDLGRVHWDAALGCVITSLSGHPRDDLLRAAFEATLSLLFERGGSAWLADLTGLSVLTDEQQRWISGNWLRRAQDAGMLHLAVVPLTSAVARLSVAFAFRGVNEPQRCFTAPGREHARFPQGRGSAWFDIQRSVPEYAESSSPTAANTAAQTRTSR